MESILEGGSHSVTTLKNAMRRLSERIELEIADFGTVVSACFQIANYMGFKRIAFYRRKFIKY